MTNNAGAVLELTAEDLETIAGGFKLIETTVRIDTVGFLTALVLPVVQPVRTA